MSQPTMVAERDGATTVVIIVNPGDAVSRIGMIFQQARRVFKLDEISGGYFCLANSDTGQEVVCVRIGIIPHNPTAQNNCTMVRERVSKVAGSSAAIPAPEPGVVRYGGMVATFAGISPQIDAALAIAFAVSFCNMPIMAAGRATRGTTCFDQFRALFLRLEAVGGLI